ncbi:MAG TPA: carbohydrate ABC transporter permease [Microlunatus sp.]
MTVTEPASRVEPAAPDSRPAKVRRRTTPLTNRPGLGESALKLLVLAIACLAVVIPFLGIVSTSLSSTEHLDESGGFVLWPGGVSLDAYKVVLSGGVVTKALLVSIGVTLVGTVASLVVTAMLAYGLSRPGSFGSRPVLLIVLFSLLFSPGLIPTYLTVRGFGLIDTYAALIVPGLVSGFNVIVLRSFFMNIPSEVLESARIDGAGDWQILTRIVAPLSKAVLAVVGLFYGVGLWNSFFNALLYLNDQSRWPLPLVLRTYVLNGTQLSSADAGAAADVLPAQPALQMAMLLIAVVPILIAYPFLQRHFTKGVITGAVKG